ncbi:MAG: hypothetical protein PHO46_03850 [Thermoguttaceae bacterium]|nr:hypothetical protein [Thermoguttaceae bacterium]
METPFLSKSSLSIPSNLPVFAFVKIANLHKKSVKVHGVVLFLEGIYKKNQKKMFFLMRTIALTITVVVDV